MQWIFVLCGCMFLLSLIATYQVCTVALKAGLYTYKAVEPTPTAFAPASLRLLARLTASVRPEASVTMAERGPMRGDDYVA